MQKKRKTFADIVRDVDAQPAVAPPTGFTPEGDLVAPSGLTYSVVDGDISPTDATAMLVHGAIAVVDLCGCKGGCKLDWIEGEKARTTVAPQVPRRRKNSQPAFIEKWKSANGSCLIYFGGDLEWS